jgi:hypothetical protein
VSNPGKNFIPTSSERSGVSATSSSFYGYFGGGQTGSTTYTNNITRLDFSNETVSNPGKNLSGLDRARTASVSNSN